MAKRTLTTWTKLTRCCLLSATCEQEFNPEKYKHLADIFGHAYLGSGSPVSIVSLFLSAFTKGRGYGQVKPMLNQARLGVNKWFNVWACKQ